MTIEQLDAMYKKSYALALAKRNPCAMVAAASALAKSQRQHTPPINLKNAKIFLDTWSIRVWPCSD